MLKPANLSVILIFNLQTPQQYKKHQSQNITTKPPNQTNKEANTQHPHQTISQTNTQHLKQTETNEQINNQSVSLDKDNFTLYML